MLAHEVLRKAAEIVGQDHGRGWSRGSAAARDVSGRETSLYGPAVGGTSRVGINPNAVMFSLYGAVAKVLASPAGAGVAASAMWLKLAEVARRRSPAREGGTNHVNPIIQFNADPERTAQDVIELLTEAADELEQQGLMAGRAS
jgi:hypothetical protein